MTSLTKVSQTKTVTFNNVTMLGIQTESGKVFTSVKKICEDLGIDDKGQIQRIKRDETLNEGRCIIHLPSNSGNQDVFCIDVDYLPFWLVGIQSKRCKPEIQSLLLEFKKKAKDVLANAFINTEIKQEQPKTQAEILLGSIQLLVSMEKQLKETTEKLNTTTEKVDKILTMQEENTKKLFEVEKSDVLPFQETSKIKLKKLVNSFSGATGIIHGKVWTKLYKEFYYRYGKNISLLSERQKKTGLQIAEELFALDDLFNLASEILDVEKFKLAGGEL